jgi:PilZ domain
MSLATASFARRSPGLVSRIVPDRRRNKRVAVALLGRFLRTSNKQEYPCKLHDISVSGAAIMAPVELAHDERIVAYFDHIGGIEGTVVRIFDGGFAIKLAATQHKKEKLAAQLTWLINRSELDGLEARRHERNKPGNGSSTLQLTEGIVISCQVLDISISGASIGTNARPALGQEVHVGKLRARVMRHHEQGIGVMFLDVQSTTALRKYFG